MTKWEILRIVGKAFNLGLRVVAVVPTAWYHRRQALAAFHRELSRNQIPASVRRRLGERYRAMLPLNPVQYRRPLAHSRTFDERTLPDRGPKQNSSHQLAEQSWRSKEYHPFTNDSHFESHS